MKFAVSMALVVLLLGMPLACILVACDATPAHPCCPRTTTNIRCPYDLFDSAKVASVSIAAHVPATIGIAIAPASASIMLVPEDVGSDGSDLFLLNRILRI
jgi:hypothetical protein